MSEDKKYTIKKIDAAIRQLDVAIRMWFQEDDIIATHVLACSAHEIIKDINIHQKRHHLIFDNPYIKEEYRHILLMRLKIIIISSNTPTETRKKVQNVLLTLIH